MTPAKSRVSEYAAFGCSIFDDGDERGELTKLMKIRGYPEPVYQPKIDKVTPVGIIPGRFPLQAADMLVYEARLNYQQVR
jgi:hypothetical protein